MFKNSCRYVFKLNDLGNPHILKNGNFFKLPLRCLNTDQKKKWFHKKKAIESDTKELVKVKPREIFEKEFPKYYNNGKFITRTNYVDFIDEALERMKLLGLDKDLESYKELLRVFPPGKYAKKSMWDIGIFHAPQQLCAIRLLHQMEQSMLRPDKEVEQLVVQAFSKSSEVWLKCTRMIFWTMKGSNIDPNPLPEEIPKEAYKVAKLGIARMLNDPKSIISVRNTSTLPNVVDKTWVVYAQSPTQQSIIEKLDNKTILYIEEAGLTHIRENYLTYFVLRLYYDEDTKKKIKQEPKPDFNYNTVKMKFYGKPINEKIQELETIHQVEDGQILAVGITGTSSHDSILSWLKLLQQRNPNLRDLNVVFRVQKSSYTEVLDPNKIPHSASG